MLDPRKRFQYTDFARISQVYYCRCELFLQPLRHKRNHLLFGPVAVAIRRAVGDESAVAAMPCDPQRDVRVAGQARIVEGPGRHERVILGCDDEGGNANPVDDAHRAGAMVIVLGAVEAELRGGEHFVELTDGADLGQAASPGTGRGGSAPCAASAPSAADEVPLVRNILPSLERAHAGAELQHRRHRTDSAKSGGRRVAVVARKFEREIAAEGVAGDDDPVDPLADDFVG